jgi:AraC-like DNA-binding protein
MNPNAWLSQISPRLNTAWRGSWKTGMIEPARYLYDHELVLVTEGSCRVQLGRAFYEMRAGSFLIIPPGVGHSTTTNPGGVRRICFHFDWTPPTVRRRRLPFWVYHPRYPKPSDIQRAPAFVPRRKPSRQFDPTGPVAPLMETIFHRWQTGSEQDRATCHPVFTEMLLVLLWRKGAGKSLPDRTAHLAYAVKDLLDQTSSRPLAIQPLLRTMGFSYAHLCRLFKATFGLSPVQYRNAARLERAKNFLRDPKRTIAEAAYAAGFDDPAYFSRKFHERHGIPPSEARR